MTIASMMTVEKVNLMTDYPTKFHDFRRNAVQLALSRLNPKPDAPLEEREKERSLHALDYVLDDAIAWPGVWHLLDRLAPKMEQAGHRDDWRPVLEKGIKLCQSQNERHAEAQLSLHLGYLHLLVHHYDAATETFKASERLYRKLGNMIGVGWSLNRLAMVALWQNHSAQAKEMASAALAHLPSGDPERANSFYVLGTIEYEVGHPADALPHLQASLDHWRASGSRRKTAWGLRNLGPALRLAGRLEEAQACYEQALQILTEVVDPLNQARVLMNIGIVRAGFEDYAGAIKFYEDSVVIFQELNDTQSLAKAYLNMGIDLRSLKKFQDSEKVLLQSIQIRHQLNNQPLLYNAMLELWITYRQMAENQKAEQTLDNLTKGIAKLKESLETEKFAARLARTVDELQEATQS